MPGTSSTDLRGNARRSWRPMIRPMHPSSPTSCPGRADLPPCTWPPLPNVVVRYAAPFPTRHPFTIHSQGQPLGCLWTRIRNRSGIFLNCLWWLGSRPCPPLPHGPHVLLSATSTRGVLTLAFKPEVDWGNKEQELMETGWTCRVSYTRVHRFV